MRPFFPLFSQTPAKKVLVVGGGDGGVLREVCRHKSVESVELAEIDEGVVNASKRFLPAMALGFEDPRVTVHICDGIKFVQDAAESSYDVIIVDSSDPVGPAEVLFEKPFFEAMHRALRPGGMIATQGESLWFHLDIIKALASMCSSVFENGSVHYGFTTIPTYPSGQIGFMICAKAREGSGPLDVRVPRREVPEPACKYYNSDVHRAAFVLPQFAKEALEGSLTAV